jgi:mRNA-degrading endonuclease RelE of RelBE toxin-antitoxin system
VAAYSIDIRPRARRSLSQLDPAVRKAVAQTIDAPSTNLGLQVISFSGLS